MEVLAAPVFTRSSAGESVPCLSLSFWGLPAILVNPWLVDMSLQSLPLWWEKAGPLELGFGRENAVSIGNSLCKASESADRGRCGQSPGEEGGWPEGEAGISKCSF